MDTDDTARISNMLIRCGIERGVLGRIDADNVARILAPVVDAIAAERAAAALEETGAYLNYFGGQRAEVALGGAPYVHRVLCDRAAALRKEAGL